MHRFPCIILDSLEDKKALGKLLHSKEAIETGRVDIHIIGIKDVGYIEKLRNILLSNIYLGIRIHDYKSFDEFKNNFTFNDCCSKVFLLSKSKEITNLLSNKEVVKYE